MTKKKEKSRLPEHAAIYWRFWQPRFERKNNHPVSVFFPPPVILTLRRRVTYFLRVIFHICPGLNSAGYMRARRRAGADRNRLRSARRPNEPCGIHIFRVIFTGHRSRDVCNVHVWRVQRSYIVVYGVYSYTAGLPKIQHLRNNILAEGCLGRPRKHFWISNSSRFRVTDRVLLNGMGWSSGGFKGEAYLK